MSENLTLTELELLGDFLTNSIEMLNAKLQRLPRQTPQAIHLMSVRILGAFLKQVKQQTCT